MYTTTTIDRDLIAKVSKKIVADVAPEEIDIFDELLQDYFFDPTPPDLTAKPMDDPLGWGAIGVIADVTKATAAMVTASLGFIAQATEGPNERSMKDYLVKKKQDPGILPLLGPDKLTRLRQVAIATARQYGMDGERAQEMANAMLVSLLLGEDAESVGAPKPIKILFLAANPQETQTLRLDQEIRSIDEALRLSESRQRFQIEQHWAVRVSDLQGLLLRHRPDIVHFSGHGSPASALILEDAAGWPQVVPSAALADLFGALNHTVRCVLLNACYSQAQATAIAQHVDAVIGMADAIGDQASVAFAAAFYQALGYGKDVHTAFRLGVSEIKLRGLADAAIPQLVTR